MDYQEAEDLRDLELSEEDHQMGVDHPALRLPVADRPLAVDRPDLELLEEDHQVVEGHRGLRLLDFQVYLVVPD